MKYLSTFDSEGNLEGSVDIQFIASINKQVGMYRGKYQVNIFGQDYNGNKTYRLFIEIYETEYLVIKHAPIELARLSELIFEKRESSTRGRI